MLNAEAQIRLQLACALIGAGTPAEEVPARTKELRESVFGEMWVHAEPRQLERRVEAGRDYSYTPPQVTLPLPEPGPLPVPLSETPRGESARPG